MVLLVDSFDEYAYLCCPQPLLALAPKCKFGVDSCLVLLAQVLKNSPLVQLEVTVLFRELFVVAQMLPLELPELLLLLFPVHSLGGHSLWET